MNKDDVNRQREQVDYANVDHLVSVIIPVYNVRSYIEECVDSVLAQTYTNLEIILVDDGSTDGSGDLCDRYVESYPLVSVIHKANGGLGDARNVGLRACHGEYVSFIDSDDYVAPCFIEALHHAVAATGCSIAAIPFGTVFREGETPELLAELPERNALGIRVMDDEEYIKKLLYQEVDTAAQWRLYRRDVLGSNPFPVEVYYEDLASIYRIVRSAAAIALLQTRALYAYRMRPGSILHNSDYLGKIASAIAITNQLHDDICAWYPKLTAAASSRCFSVCRNAYSQIPFADTEARTCIWDLISRYRRVVLEDREARRRERIAAAVSAMGQPAFYSFCVACRKVGLMV